MTKSKNLVGSLVKISLSNGFVYGLCTHDLGASGQVLLLYTNVYSVALPQPAADLSGAKVRTAIKFPLKYVLKEPEVEIVGQRKLKGSENKLPIFRSLGLAAPSEKPKGWWIIDGEKETWVDALTSDMAHFPDDGIYNLAAIEELYERDLYPHSPSLLERGPLTFSLSKLQ